MVTADERLKILRMIQDGKITPEEGIRLIEAMEVSEKRPRPETPPEAFAAPPGRQARYLCVCVTDTDSGKVRVNVRMPINVVNAGLKMGARFSPEIEGLNTEQLMEFVRSGETGKILDVFDDEDGEHVEVYIE